MNELSGDLQTGTYHGKFDKNELCLLSDTDASKQESIPALANVMSAMTLSADLSANFPWSVSKLTLPNSSNLLPVRKHDSFHSIFIRKSFHPPFSPSEEAKKDGIDHTYNLFLLVTNCWHHRRNRRCQPNLIQMRRRTSQVQSAEEIKIVIIFSHTNLRTNLIAFQQIA